MSAKWPHVEMTRSGTVGAPDRKPMDMPKRAPNPNAVFLTALAETVARDKDREAITEHLNGMGGAEGAFFCFSLLQIFKRSGDVEGVQIVDEIIRKEVG